MPDYLRITEVTEDCVGDDGISLILGEGQASVFAVGKALLLMFARTGIECEHRTLSETCSIVLVDHCAAGENVAPFVAEHGYRFLLPVNEIGGGSMAPAHVAPVVALRIVLVVEMVDSVDVDHAVRIVCPVFGGSIVYLWSVLFVS